MKTFLPVPHLHDSIFLLIQKTATHLPLDVLEAMENAKKNEKKDSNAEFSLNTLTENIYKAQKKTVPMCQDTGFPTFFVSHSPEFSQKIIEKNIHKAVQKATKKGLLRPNAVDSLTGKNSGDNMGISIPKIIFSLEEEKENFLEIKLLLKGGGSENVSAQHALPCQTDFGRAGRDLEGVKKVILQTVKNAQGKGCAPGILGIHIGGDRATGYEKSKLNFFRKLTSEDFNPEKTLDILEKEVLAEANTLNIGPMGFGGKSTLLDVKISASHRIPASFFVTISYSCWALRRGEICCESTGALTPSPSPQGRGGLGVRANSSTKKLIFPLSEKNILDLHVGEKVLLSGKIFTGRDTIHHYVVEEKKTLPKNLSGLAIYHCGPIMTKNPENSGDNDENNVWQVIAAGPTTSIREEPYQAEFIEKTGVRAIIGKGGMGEKTLAGLQKFKAVYFHAIGGAAAVYAEKITQVKGVDFEEEFGIPEALWELEIKDFPVIVTMDAHGKSLHNSL